MSQATSPSRIEPRRAGGLPRVHPAAWDGPLGQAVVRIAPTTEADPVAVLATTIALFGAMVGDGPHVRVGGVRHPARVWPLIVGKTGSGRKGTSLAEAAALAGGWGGYAGSYVRHRLLGAGLSSGEGLLTALGASVTNGQADTPEKEAQAPDGKLTVTETEFARTLTAAKRDGSTLGPILRQLWDSGSAQILTKAAPLKVDGAHLGLVAHVTPLELRARLADTDLAGGTVNRFLIIASERPHLLPREPPHPDLSELAGWLGRALDEARGWDREVRRDREAEELWPAVYYALSAEEPDGLLGAVLARGPAYTMRIALAFCLADGSSSISKSHLLTALALWHYSTASARLLFSDATTRTDERRLAKFIADEQQGRTRTEVYRFFAGNRPAAAIDALLDLLERTGQITVTIDAPAGGRPAQRYRWAGRAIDPILQILSECQ